MCQSGNIAPMLKNNNLSYTLPESLKRNDIETFCLSMADEVQHRC